MIIRLSCYSLLLSLTILISGAQSNPGGRLLITEIFYDTPGTDAQEEWLEIYNVGPEQVDLSSYKVGDEETAGGREGMVRFPVGVLLAPGQAIVVAQTAVGFRGLFGHDPSYEIYDSSPVVPNMLAYPQWASGSVALANDGDELLLLDGLDNIVDGVSYGASIHYFAPSINDVLTGQSLERTPSNCDTDSAAEWRPQGSPTPGTSSQEGICPLISPSVLVQTGMPIGAIQGNSDVSPLINQFVRFQGILTGIQEDRNVRGIVYTTLFVQDTTETNDGDPATSDGIAVFLARQEPNYEVGDVLAVSGTVSEFFGLTEIIDATVHLASLGSEARMPLPITLSPPTREPLSRLYFEAHEGMLVAMPPSSLVIGPTHTGCGMALANPNSTMDRILSREPDSGQNHVIPVLNLSDVDCAPFPSIKTGDRVSAVSGPLTYHFDRYKIVNQNPRTLRVERAPEREILPAKESAAGQISIATFNLSNHFDSVSDVGPESEPVPTVSEVARKQVKLAFALSSLLRCPTVVAVQEVEKRSLLETLVRYVVSECGFKYEISHLESVDQRGIDVALLSDPRIVTILHVTQRQACSTIRTDIDDPLALCSENEHPLFSRPPLQVQAELFDQEYTFLVNHFKSKRGGAEQTAPRRLAQAQFVSSLMEEYLAANQDSKVIVLGDFNDVELSAPMMEMTGAGLLTNALLLVEMAERYSVIFDGESQLVDGILISPSLEEELSYAAIVHVNADQPFTLSGDTSPAGIPFRSSDHDLPVIILGRPSSLEEATSAPTPPVIVATSLAGHLGTSDRLPTPTPKANIDVRAATVKAFGTVQSPAKTPRAAVAPVSNDDALVDSPALGRSIAKQVMSRATTALLILIIVTIIWVTVRATRREG